MSGGRYVRRPQKPVLSLKKKILLAACLILTVFAAVAFLRFRNISTLLESQKTADVWRGESEERFAQISVFLPETETADVQKVESFRGTLDQKLIDASMEAPENGRLYADAYCGFAQIKVSGEHGSDTVQTICVGGDYFLFHPLQLRSGSYITGRDYMQDRVVLDEELAWALFGSSDVAGQEVTIGERKYPVAGVVRREDDYATDKAWTEKSGMFMSYDALADITDLSISCYEIVLPDAVSGWGRTIVQENFPVGNGVTVENSSRYSFRNLMKILLSYGERSMNTHGVIYPYWENAARLTEDHAAAWLLAAMLAAFLPAVCLAVFLIRNGIRYGKKAKDRVAADIERKVEARKTARYTGGGI